MSKSNLVDHVSATVGISKVEAKKVVEATLEGIKTITNEDGKLQLLGFGTFKKHERSARVGRNPGTGEAIEIPAKTVTKFSAGF